MHQKKITKKKTNKKLYKKVRSQIHGSGLFAIEDIPKGTKIIEYLGEKITHKEADERYEKREKYARSKGAGVVYLFELNSKYCLDGNFPGNPAKAINHSCKPNCETDIKNNRVWVEAKKNIKKGEELTYDYGFDVENYEDHPCRCGADNCIGYIVAKEDWPKLKRRLAKKKQSKK